MPSGSGSHGAKGGDRLVAIDCPHRGAVALSPRALRLGPRRLVAAAFAIALGVATTSPARAAEGLLDGIAAQVGHEYVLISEIEELARPVAERMREAGAPAAEIRKMRSEALDRLIEAKLIETVVTRLEMEASEEEIDQTIEGIATDNGLTVGQLRASVESHGLTIEEYRDKLKGELERSRVINTLVRSRVRVEPEEIQRAYAERYGDQRDGGEEAHLRHIMVAAGDESGRDERTACVIAQDAADQIRAGEMDFREMARRVTEMNPEQQGELGWFHIDEIAPWMTTALASMEEGDVSDAISMPFGCNVLQLVERRRFTPVSFQQAERGLRDELSGRKMEKEYLGWLESVRKQTYVSLKGVYAQDRARP